jgi:hypothetical protein
VDPNSLASSATVRSPLIAASATFALNRVVLLPCPLHVLPRYPRALEAGLHLSQLFHFRGPAQRTSSPAIARQLGLPISTVAKILCRLGLNRLKALDPPVPIIQYERERPGLVCRPRRRGRADRDRQWQLLSQPRFRQLCAQHGLRHLRTRPYGPRTNGKAERFIQTSPREWAYARPYARSQSAARN